MTTSQSTCYSVPRRLRRRERRNKRTKEGRKEEGREERKEKKKENIGKEQQTSGDGKRQRDRVSQLSKQRNTNNNTEQNNKMDLLLTPNPI